MTEEYITTDSDHTLAVFWTQGRICLASDKPGQILMSRKQMNELVSWLLASEKYHGQTGEADSVPVGTVEIKKPKPLSPDILCRRCRRVPVPYVLGKRGKKQPGLCSRCRGVVGQANARARWQ